MSSIPTDSPASSRQWLPAPEWMIDRHRRVPICVIGAGGTGGEIMDQLCRLHATLQALNHPGLHVTLYDGDTICASNVGRQRFGASEVGQNKAVSLVNRINLFYGLDWSGVPLHWQPANGSAPLTITATDSAALRHRFAEVDASRGDWLWLDFGNGADKAQAVLGHRRVNRRITSLGPAHDETRPRLPHVIDLFPDMVDDPDDGPSCSVAEAIRAQRFGINAALVCTAMTTIIWPLFRHGRIDRHGLFLDAAQGTSRPLHIDPAGWALLGYVCPRRVSCETGDA